MRWPGCCRASHVWSRGRARRGPRTGRSWSRPCTDRRSRAPRTAPPPPALLRSPAAARRRSRNPCLVLQWSNNVVVETLQLVAPVERRHGGNDDELRRPLRDERLEPFPQLGVSAGNYHVGRVYLRPSGRDHRQNRLGGLLSALRYIWHERAVVILFDLPIVLRGHFLDEVDLRLVLGRRDERRQPARPQTANSSAGCLRVAPEPHVRARLLHGFRQQS